MDMDDRWQAVDAYFAGAVLAADPALASALESNAAAGLPAYDVSPLQGQLLGVLVEAANARRVLEIGTLGGFSTIWLARAVGPSGSVTTLELEPDYARVAAVNVARAGLADRVSIRIGRAAESLAALAAEGVEPFDLVFIDADKPSNREYLSWALKLSRPGTMILVDNVVRDGAVADASSTDPEVLGARDAIALLAREPRVRATAVQTVGVKGYDGFAIAIVREV
ncbi:MAG: O-methyltransferase [Gemmatimonadaceae bacterium]|nr:O-methyltransferase [Gemmatimonadaceae bacterium]